VRFSVADILAKMGSQRSLSVYLGLIALLTLLFSAGLMAIAHTQDVPDEFSLLTGILALLSTSQLALTLVNWLATLFVRPHPLPRMDFSNGIPSQSRTLVVVPTMLTNPQSVDDLVEALEVRFLANRDDNLYFGLLTDFRDAHEENARRRRVAVAAGPGTNRDAECKIWRCRKEYFLSFSSPAPLESARAHLDGLRT